MKKCVFAGTFDPPTFGHLDTIKQSLLVFDEVVVAILINNQKKPMFTTEQRVEMLKMLTKGEERVKIRTFQGVVVDLLQEENTRFFVRGLRNTVDFEYENANLYASRRLYPDIVNLYFPARQEFLHISSTLVKNSILFNKSYEEYVPKDIIDYINTIKKD